MTTCGFGNDISQAFKAYAPESHHIYYRPQTKFAKVTVLHMSVVLFKRGSLSACRDTNPLGADTPRIRPLGSRHPPGADTPQADTHHGQTPPRADTPQSSACWEIRAITGRYASYWNAYLFSTKFCTSQKVLTIPYLDRSVYVY